MRHYFTRIVLVLMVGKKFFFRLNFVSDNIPQLYFVCNLLIVICIYRYVITLDSRSKYDVGLSVYFTIKNEALWDRTCPVVSQTKLLVCQYILLLKKITLSIIHGFS